MATQLHPYWQNLLHRNADYGEPLPMYFYIIYMYFQADNDMPRPHWQYMMRFHFPVLKRFKKRIIRSYKKQANYGTPICPDKVKYFLTLSTTK